MIGSPRPGRPHWTWVEKQGGVTGGRAADGEILWTVATFLTLNRVSVSTDSSGNSVRQSPRPSAPSGWFGVLLRTGGSWTLQCALSLCLLIVTPVDNTYTGRRVSRLSARLQESQNLHRSFLLTPVERMCPETAQKCVRWEGVRTERVHLGLMDRWAITGHVTWCESKTQRRLVFTSTERWLRGDVSTLCVFKLNFVFRVTTLCLCSA